MVTHRSNVQKTPAGHHGGLRRGTAAAALGVVLALSAGAPASHAAAGAAASVPAATGSLSIDLDGLVDGLLGPSKTPTPSPSSPSPQPTASEEPDEPEPSRTADAVTHADDRSAARGTPGARDPAAHHPCRARAGRARGSRAGPVSRIAGPGRRRPGRGPGPRGSRPVAVDHCPCIAVGRRRFPDRDWRTRNGVGQAPVRQHFDGSYVNAPACGAVAFAGRGHRPRCTVPHRRWCGPADAARLTELTAPSRCPESGAGIPIDVK